MKLQGQLEGQFWAAAAAGQPNLCVFYHTHTEKSYYTNSTQKGLLPASATCYRTKRSDGVSGVWAQV